MATVAAVLTVLVAALHIYFLVLEMFLWATPFGQRAFKRTAEEQASSKVLAANQGLYNGFLAAGLLWTVIGDASALYSVRVFFLVCVVIAGLYGAVTASRTILFAQALPGALALAATLAAR